MVRAVEQDGTTAQIAASQSPPDVHWLRRAPTADPAAGSTLRLELAPNAAFELSEQIGEGFLLAGSAHVGSDRLAPGSYVWWPAGGGTRVQAGAEGARLLLVLGGLSVPAGTDVPCHRWDGLLDGAVGYLDRFETAYRQPLRRERTRGEMTWLLLWPAGLHDSPTAATGVGLEGLVLEGELHLGATNYAPGAYLWFDAGALPAEWQTTGGCRLLLRTVASTDDDR